jgi:hypothetical protein
MELGEFGIGLWAAARGELRSNGVQVGKSSAKMECERENICDGHAWEIIVGTFTFQLSLRIW